MNVHKYSVAILTTNESIKTPTAISNEIGMSQSSGSRFLNRSIESVQNTIAKILRFFKDKFLNFVIDDLVVSRRYADPKHTEAISSMKDTSTKTFTNGVCVVIGGVTDGKFFLPISLELWVCEEIMGLQYAKKSDLAERMIEKILTFGLNIKYFVLDGLYFSERFINFLDDKKLKFIIKAKTTTLVELDGERIQLQNCPALHLNSNQNHKKIVAKWCKKEWFFIAIKRSGKRGEKIMYLIANFDVTTKTYSKIYDSRWKIEKFIRTAKQHLGLKNSQSQIAKVYINHMKLAMEAYIVLQFIMKKFRLDSAEDALRKVQSLKMNLSFNQIADRISLWMAHA